MKKRLTEYTMIEIGKAATLSQYRDWFETATGCEMSGWEFQAWLGTQVGKRLADAKESFVRTSARRPMRELLEEERFSIISDTGKAFILAFDDGISQLGYDCGGGIGDGYCWGKYMIVYSKIGAKSKKVAARIFIRENEVVLRLFLNGIDRHRDFIENAPEHIKDVFVGSHGDCCCHPKKENCRMRKTYTLDGRVYEKCSGVVFELRSPTVEKTPDYIALLTQFYPPKKL